MPEHFVLRIIKKKKRYYPPYPPNEGGTENNREEKSSSDNSRLEQMELDTDKKKKELSNESKKSANRFSPPSIDEVKSYVLEKGYQVDAEQFFDFYQSKGWYVGKNKMKDWRAAVRNRERTEKGKLYGTGATNRQTGSTPQERYGEAAKLINRLLAEDGGSLEVTATGEEDYKTTF